MVCKVFFAKNFRKKAGNRVGNSLECILMQQYYGTATKTRKKGGPFWFVPGTLPLQTRRVKAAAFRPGFTPGKAPWRVAQQG